MYRPQLVYDGYYSDLKSWQNGEDLINQLNTISRKTYRPLSYADPNYETNINADHSYYDYEYLDVVYSETDIHKGQTNKGWQREHAFCASLMCGTLTSDAVKMKGRATDFHNLFAATASGNTSRGNKNYGIANKSLASYRDKTTNGGKDGYSYDNQLFEPADKDKGRLARAIFYMAMMYKDDEQDTVNNVLMKGLKIETGFVEYSQENPNVFAIGNLNTLLNWNNNYPVDYLEMQHNISVYKDVYSKDGYAQGNRNPFVDYPDLVNYCFGSEKNTPNSLDKLADSASEAKLDCGSSNNELSHYALKEAKRSYEPGTQINDADYKVVKVLKNYTYEVVTEGYINSLKDHTFAESDGNYLDATISAGSDNITYRITINGAGATSTGEIHPNTTGINKGTPNEDQAVTYNDIPFYVNFQSSASIDSVNTMYLVNDNVNGGITIGSKSKPCTRFELRTKNNYTVDAVYIKAFTGNSESIYQLTIKVGETVLLYKTTVNTGTVKQYVVNPETPVTGEITYIFTGSSSLKINSIAFNEII